MVDSKAAAALSYYGRAGSAPAPWQCGVKVIACCASVPGIQCGRWHCVTLNVWQMCGRRAANGTICGR